MRVVAVTFCVTLAASLAARQGSTSMAAFQVCLQVWLATSLLADGLAVAGQVGNFPLFMNCLLASLLRLIKLFKWNLCILFSFSNLFREWKTELEKNMFHSPILLEWLVQAILASAFAQKDYDRATATASRVLQVLLNGILEGQNFFHCSFIFSKVKTRFKLAVRFGSRVDACDIPWSGNAVWG